MDHIKQLKCNRKICPYYLNGKCTVNAQNTNDKDKQFVWLHKGDTEPVLEKYERHDNEQK